VSIKSNTPLLVTVLLICTGFSILVSAQSIAKSDPDATESKTDSTKSDSKNAESDSETTKSDKKKKKSFDNKPIFEFEGLLMLDSSAADGLYSEDEERVYDNLVRRARIGVDVNMHEKLSLNLSAEAENGESKVELRKAALVFDYAKDGSIELGLIKQPFGLENNTSTRKIRTVERSMASNVFVPGKGHGVSWSITPKARYLSVGAFADPDDDNLMEFSGRAAVATIEEKRHVLQFGVSAVYRENDGQEYRVRDSGVFETGENFFKSGRYNTDHLVTVGLEAAWSKGPFLVQSEWFNQSLTLNSDEDGRDPDFSGGYLHLGYVFNDGRRKFKNGSFGNLSGDKRDRAVEFFTGVGYVDTIFEDKGDRAVETILGVNFQFNKHIRLAGQLQNINTTDDQGREDDGNGLIVRLIVQ